MFSNKNDKIEKVDKILTNEAFEELQVDFADINLAIENFQGAILISSPKPAILFQNRLVAFLMTPIGLIELLNAN